MYILFEEHQYESHLVEKILKDIYVLQDINKKVNIQVSSQKMAID